MEGILISCVVMIIALMLIAVFIRAYTDFWYRILVTNKHEAIDFLMKEGGVPEKWRAPRFLRRGQADGPPGVFFARLYLYRLSRLVAYVRRSTLISADDRAQIADALRETGRQWRAEWKTRQPKRLEGAKQ